ncbi:hypothetical protein [Promicromonospora sp. MEB111]|uniref:hypothetical protein n=1 Tax=Promicromonospora sp. MEB111 TaxID=3040301 RepID=UPI00254AE0B6|nr:hypothetical protein [Promicromonospora sp. MEB111]
MVSSAITPKRTIAVLIGVAVIAVAAFAVVRSGVFEPETVQGAIPGPGSSSPSASASASPSATPAPEPSASPTTPEQIKAKNIADAKARLTEYYETTAQVANNGYKDWADKLLPFWGNPDIWGPTGDAFEQLASEGRYTTGSAEVVSSEVTDYKPNENGFESVALTACVDFSRVKNFDKNGDLIARQAGAPSRYIFSYLIRHQGPETAWTVNTETPHPEKAC